MKKNNEPEKPIDNFLGPDDFCPRFKEEKDVKAPLATPEDRFWQDLMLNEKKESIASIEDAAKQLIAIDSGLTTVYVALISFSKLPDIIGRNLAGSQYSIIQLSHHVFPFLDQQSIAFRFLHLISGVFTSIMVDIYKFYFIMIFVSPILVWVISLYYAAKVLAPREYFTDLNSPCLSRQAYKKIVSYKHKELERAHNVLVLGFVLFIINTIIYLWQTL